MKDLFISFEQALDLKELKFDEKCFAHYSSFGYYNSEQELKWKRPTTSLINGVLISNKDLTWQEDETIILKQATAPLYQQVFKWFREKYNLYSIIFYHTDNKIVFEHPHYFRIYEMKYKGKQIEHSKEFKTYEEAELECIKKLIEIVKNDKNL